jgi:hypothetical protein
MNEQADIPRPEPLDTLIDEVRSIRRRVCEAAGHDVDRLCDQLQELTRQYDAREGLFAAVTVEAAQRVVERWGQDAQRRDDPVVDQVRAIRKERALDRGGSATRRA